jgi:hypothetical protein
MPTKHPKQPTIYRQKRPNRPDTAFTVIDGQRIYLGTYGSPEAEKEYRRVVAEWNTGIITPKQTQTANITVAELVLRFLKERKQKVSAIQWDKALVQNAENAKVLPETQQNDEEPE